jgi:hypothetical protein
MALDVQQFAQLIHFVANTNWSLCAAPSTADRAT